MLNYDTELSSEVNLKQLTHLIVLAEHLSMSGAAAALNISQPSISESIARLERNLGVQLATRGHKGVQMTEAGVLLASRGERILKDIRQSLNEVHELSNTPRGNVTIGLPPGLSLMISVPLLETIHAEYPDIRMSIMEAVSDETLRAIKEERVDLGCVYQATESPDLILEPLMKEEVFLVTAPDNWEGEIGPDGIVLESFSADKLADLPLVMTGARGAQAIQDRVMRSFNIELNVIATINSLPQIIEMVSRASAYAILPHGAVYKHVARGQLALVRLDEPIYHTASLVRKRTSVISKAGTIIEGYTRDIIKEVVERHGIRGAISE